LLSKGGKELKEELELLIRGETIEKAIDENIILDDIAVDEDSMWSFLLMGGYLKQTSMRKDDVLEKTFYNLAIPNKEVRSTYTRIIQRFFTGKIENKKVQIMLKALIDGDINLFEKMLRKIVTAVFSYHDFSGEPEKVYHALRRPKTFSRKGFWTSKSFSLGWFGYSFFLCVPLCAFVAKIRRWILANSLP
jgi:hypothetical protein